MGKITNLPQALNFDEGDVLVKDGENGTKQIPVSEAAKYMGRDTIMVNEQPTEGTKVVIQTTDQEYSLALMSDVDAVDDKVEEVKTQIYDITGNRKIELTPGYYVNCSIDPIDYTGSAITASSTGFAYAIVDVAPGDQFTVSAIGGSSPRAWAFIDNSGNIKSVEGPGVSVTNKVIEAPAEATKLIVNAKPLVDGFSYYGVLCKNQLDMALSVIAPNYSSSNTYREKDYVIYNDTIYRCKADISTPEAWNASHWIPVTVSSEIRNIIVDKQEQLEFAYHKKDTNYIDNTPWLENSYIDENGAVATFDGFYASPFIALDENTKYYCWYKIYSGYYAFYNANKQLVAGHGNDFSLRNGTFTTPAGTVYGRFTVRGEAGNPADAWINIYNNKPADYGFVLNNCYADYSENPCDYEGDEISVFNKILCIGDSLTSGTFNYLSGGSTGNYVVYAKYSYPTFLNKLTGCDVVNMGNSGKSSAEWYETHENDDLSGYDCAIIQLGVNDLIRYGEFGSTSQTAFTNIINKLKTENKNIKIFIANIIPALSYSSAAYIDFSDDLLAWVETVNQSDPNVIPLDIQRYGHTKSLDVSSTSDAYNCGHLSALGYRRLAEDYKHYISYYINTNKELFKEVQFIGTDYNYDPIT